MERQRKPLSIYDNDLNAYACVCVNSEAEIVSVDADTFEVKLSRGGEGCAGEFEAKKAFVSLLPSKLSEIEDLCNNSSSISSNSSKSEDSGYVIVDLKQDHVDENENGPVRTANSMSKKEYMLNFQAIANSECLDEDDDDTSNGDAKKGSLFVFEFWLVET